MADVRLGVAIDATGAEQGASRVTRAVDQMARRVTATGSVFKKTTGVIGEFARGLFSIQGLLGGLTVGAVLAGIGNTIRDFNAAISDLSAITGATGKDLEYLRNQAKEFGRTTTLSASQAAQAMKLIASAKPDLLSNAQALSEVTRQTIALAEASGTDLPQAASALGQALNQFGAGAEEAGRYVNVLAAGAKFGASEIPATAAALINAGTAAKAAGLSFEETVTAIQLMAKTGITAEQAGTKLSTIFTRLQVQSNREFNPAIVGISQALMNLRDANLSTADAAKLFGQFSINAGRALISQADAFEPLKKQLTGTATAYEQAAIKVNDLEGDTKAMGSAAEGLRIALGERLEPAFRSMAQTATAFFLALTDNLDAIGSMIGELTKLAAALAIGAVAAKATTAVLALGAAFTGIGSVIPLVVLALQGAFIPAVTAAATAIGAFLAPLLSIPVAIGAAATAISYIALNWKDWTEELEASETALTSVKGLTQGLGAALGDLSRMSDEAVAQAYERATAALAEAAAVRERLRAQQEEARSFGALMAQRARSFITGEDDTAVNQRLRALDDEARKQEQTLARQLAAIKKEQAARKERKGAIEDETEAQEGAVDAAEDETDSLKKLRDARESATKQLRDTVVDLRQQIVAIREGSDAALQYNLTYGRMSEVLKQAGPAAAGLREEIVALNKELLKAQAENDLMLPQERYRQRIDEIKELGLAKDKEAEAVHRAQEALFNETEARSRLTSEMAAQLQLNRALFDLDAATANASTRDSLAGITEQYRTHNELVSRQIDLLKQEIALLETREDSYSNSTRIAQLKAQVQDLSATYKSLGNDIRETFRDSMEDSLASALRGAKSIKDVFTDLADAILDQLARAFASDISAGITQTFMPATNGGGSGSILGGIFNSLMGGIFGARAMGGPVVANRPYVVGEGGRPEIFTPGTSGQIIPDANVGGVNVYMTINTPDANSFRASSDMIARDQLALAQRAQRFRT